MKEQNIRVDSAALLERVNQTADSFDHSRTDQNAEFVDGVIYGMALAAACIKAEERNAENES